jgi:hypothetical protein
MTAHNKIKEQVLITVAKEMAGTKAAHLRERRLQGRYKSCRE